MNELTAHMLVFFGILIFVAVMVLGTGKGDWAYLLFTTVLVWAHYGRPNSFRSGKTKK
jgi:hypothetical protein